MIFGKTDDERKAEERERLGHLYNNPTEKFALLPTKLSTGNWVWLQTYYIDNKGWIEDLPYVGYREKPFRWQQKIRKITP